MSDFDRNIVGNFNCDMEKNLNKNYWNYCVTTLNKYLTMLGFFHQAIMVEEEPTANQEGMYSGGPKHRHHFMKRYIADVFLRGQPLEQDPTDAVGEAISFYRRLEVIMRSMFGGRVQVRDMLNVDSYGEKIKTLRKTTNSARIQKTINDNREFLDRAYVVYANWEARYQEILEDYF